MGFVKNNRQKYRTEDTPGVVFWLLADDVHRQNVAVFTSDTFKIFISDAKSIRLVENVIWDRTIKSQTTWPQLELYMVFP